MKCPLPFLALLPFLQLADFQQFGRASCVPGTEALAGLQMRVKDCEEYFCDFLATQPEEALMVDSCSIELHIMMGRTNIK